LGREASPRRSSSRQSINKKRRNEMISWIKKLLKKKGEPVDMESLVLRSYDEWNYMGYYVASGEKAHSFLGNKALFSDKQVGLKRCFREPKMDASDFLMDEVAYKHHG